jgi:hypothetical protein
MMMQTRPSGTTTMNHRPLTVTVPMNWRNTWATKTNAITAMFTGMSSSTAAVIGVVRCSRSPEA